MRSLFAQFALDLAFVDLNDLILIEERRASPRHGETPLKSQQRSFVLPA
jgi:hypothetical protein